MFTFDLAAALADGGRRLHELSSAAESVGFSLERARVDEAPAPAVSTDGWTAYAPLEPETAGTGRPGGPGPPAPPSTGEPSSPGPDPADPGPPITVRLDDLLLGDLGNHRVDARLLQAILLRDRHVAEWLRSRGIEADAVEDAFPGTRWRRRPRRTGSEAELPSPESVGNPRAPISRWLRPVGPPGQVRGGEIDFRNEETLRVQGF